MVHAAIMELHKLSSDWNMGSPTSERLPTRQGKVFEVPSNIGCARKNEKELFFFSRWHDVTGSNSKGFEVTQNIPCYVFEDIKIRLGWIEVSLRKKLSHSEWKLFGKSCPLRSIKPCSCRNDMDALSIALPFGCKITAKKAPLEQMHPRQPLQLSATCCHRI